MLIVRLQFPLSMYGRSVPNNIKVRVVICVCDGGYWLDPLAFDRFDSLDVIFPDDSHEVYSFRIIGAEVYVARSEV